MSEWIATEDVSQGRAPEKFAGLLDYPSLHRYRAWRYLGAGAFGVVYAGVRDGLGRTEAVKRMQIADPRLRHLALLETQLMANLPPHPHLVTLYNAEESHEALFLTMQFIDGKPADKLALPAPLERAIKLTRDAAAALQLLHAQGFVHRDIKPANLFCKADGNGVLGDYGVARHMSSEDGVARIAGTPAYMAPEAFTGAATPASDLWSLGVMLYELLVGERPFQSTEALSLEERPAALRASFAYASVCRPGVPPRLDELVTQLLAYSPKDRPPSATAVLDALPRYDTLISALPADLTQLEVDAVAVSANERLTMNVPGSVAHAVAEAGGEIVVAAAQSYAPAKPGTVVVTPAGTLAARFVFHAITLRVDDDGTLKQARERDVRRALWMCFRKAHELQLKSLGLPAFGTASGGLLPDEAARMMVDVTHTYLLEFRPPLERVIFALPDKMIALAFREAALERGLFLG
ncbi:MAG TPA: serine/threonine-protein kinase [Kofleriaceae bacterium]|nr:serine/threonine-protein kinase [Kofleriaceae bacterium]